MRESADEILTVSSDCVLLWDVKVNPKPTSSQTGLHLHVAVL